MRFLRNLAGIFVGKIVLRAQLIPIGELYGLKYIWAKLFYSKAEITRLNGLWNEFKEKNKQQQSVNVKRQFIKTPQGVTLDTIELSDKNKDPTEYVIYGWGRSCCYEYYLSRLATDALNLNKKIISFNFRGVGHSKGQVTNGRDLVDDYKFQIMRLIKKSVKPEQIKCYGHSLCGAIAVYAVEELNREGYAVKLCNDRSFASLVDTSITLYFKRPNSRARLVNIAAITLQIALLSAVVACGLLTWMQTALIGVAALLSVRWKVTHHIYDRTLGRLMESTMRFVMHFGKWEYYTPKAYENIPENNRMHTLVREPKSHFSKTLGRRKVLNPALDRVIMREDSMHRHLTQYHKQKKELKHLLIKAKQKGEHRKITELKEKLINMSNAKLTGGGHMSDPKELVTWYKTPRSGRWSTLQERFYNFVEPEGQHQETHPIKYKSF